MSGTKVLSKITTVASGHRKIWVGAGVLTSAILASVAVGAPPLSVLFAVFTNDNGTVQTASSDPSTLNNSNPFFDPFIGTNGQSCQTCHQPSIGITVSVPFIQNAFNATKDGPGPLDPLFRPNDTANNPSTNFFSKDDKAYSLILNLGVVRIGKPLPTGANAPDFTVVAADAATNEMFAAPDTFPLTTDPQHPGVPSLSVFRRPLVNTNVNFDSAVLWDGRANISNMPAQVKGAIQTLLLGADNGNNITLTDTAIANFMTGVFTDQKSSSFAGLGPGFTGGAGNLTAVGATGGVLNLLALSQSKSRPCVFDEDTPPDLTPFVAAVATPTSCTQVVVGGQIVGGPPTFTLFDTWANLPFNPGNKDRLSVARGQAVFNTALGSDDNGKPIGCVFCHTVPNLGNNASAGADGFKRIGTDSLDILMRTKAKATTPAEAQMMQDMIDRVGLLPQYCLRPNTDTSGTPCGSAADDVVTTDPGRALVTGRMADVGMFKPPILRNLAVRSPYFHAGAAQDIQHLINFYNLRFGLGLTADQQADLAKFIDTSL